MVSFSGNSLPQQSHRVILWITIASGLATIRNLLPVCPFCPPGLSLDLPLKLLVFRKGSWEGETLLFRLFFGFSCLAKRSFNELFSFCKTRTWFLILSIIIAVSFLKDSNSFCKDLCAFNNSKICSFFDKTTSVLLKFGIIHQIQLHIIHFLPYSYQATLIK